jgi:hypothetical protein
MFSQLATLAINPRITVQVAWEARDELRYQIRLNKISNFPTATGIVAFSPHQGTFGIIC